MFMFTKLPQKKKIATPTCAPCAQNLDECVRCTRTDEDEPSECEAELGTDRQTEVMLCLWSLSENVCVRWLIQAVLQHIDLLPVSYSNKT